MEQVKARPNGYFFGVVNGTRFCRHCGTGKHISQFPVKKKPNGQPSYGRCLQCTHEYDYQRRRGKGQPIAVRINKDKETFSEIKVTPGYTERVYMRKSARRPKEQQPIHDCVCKECNAPFKGYQDSVFCCVKHGERYGRRIRKKKERARMRKAVVEHVDPIVVFQRNNWHCAICGVHTPRHLKGKHKPTSPELDHIIPLSKGGEHSYANTQCLCRACNALKSNT